MLFHANLPLSMWVEAFSTAVYTINRLPSSSLQGISPFEALFGTSPNYGNFHPFGCRVYPCLRDYATNKFSIRSRPCIFVGYCSNHKGFRCFDPVTSRVYITRHAKFDELVFLFAGHASPSQLSQLDVSIFLEPSTLPSTAKNQPLFVVPTPSPMTAPCQLCPFRPTHSTSRATKPNGPVHFVNYSSHITWSSNDYAVESRYC